MSLDALLARARGSRARVVLAGGDDGMVEAIAGRRGTPAFAEHLPDTFAVVDRHVRFRERANVLIFPGGAAGHLALRTARELARARLLGPLLLGPAGVVMGVTEDADDAEMAGTVALAALVAARAGT